MSITIMLTLICLRKLSHGTLKLTNLNDTIFSMTMHVILIILVLLALLSDLKKGKFKKKIPYELFPKFTLQTPYSEAETNSVTFNSRLLNIEFNYSLNPVCSDQSIFMVIYVSSALRNYKKRKLIRDRVLRNGALKVVFGMGTDENSTLMADVISESNLYKDIVLGNFIDSYRNLTYKHMMGLKWASQYCPTAKYVVKMDDDVDLNSFEMVKFVTRQLSPWGAKGLMLCVVNNDEPVGRDIKYKWYLSKDDFEPDYFPSFCAGVFILYSQDVVPLLVEASQTTKFLYIDDVYVTGILRQKLGLSLSNLSYLSDNLEYMKNLRDKGFMNVKGINKSFISPDNESLPEDVFTDKELQRYQQLINEFTY